MVNSDRDVGTVGRQVGAGSGPGEDRSVGLTERVGRGVVPRQLHRWRQGEGARRWGGVETRGHKEAMVMKGVR